MSAALLRFSIALTVFVSVSLGACARPAGDACSRNVITLEDDCDTSPAELICDDLSRCRLRCSEGGMECPSSCRCVPNEGYDSGKWGFAFCQYREDAGAQPHGELCAPHRPSR